MEETRPPTPETVWTCLGLVGSMAIPGAHTAHWVA